MTNPPEGPVPDGPPLRIIVLGGGSAGWITAATLMTRGPAARITVVASPETPRIGVGEATIPTIRTMLQRFGIAEAALFSNASATIKHGIAFEGWTGPGSRYLHPFHRDLSAQAAARRQGWIDSDRSGPFAEVMSLQGAMIARNLAPRAAFGEDYSGLVPYAYHLDAEAFADHLAGHCQARGVRLVEAHVDAVIRDGPRVIELRLTDGRTLSADLFVDCSGARALLSPQAHQAAGWVDQSEQLICDSAVTLQIPNPPDHVPASLTRARALGAGWAWDIGLQHRRGRGYVYASRHSSAEAAEVALRRDEGVAAADLPARHLRFRVGRMVAPWHGNTVAIGLAAGFLEPLESTGLWLADFAARVLAELLPPDPGALAEPALAARHNALVAETHDEILDFIQLHYALARVETPFWRDAADPVRLTPRLRDLLAIWRWRPPSFADFSLRYPPFNHVNYDFILFGSDGPAPAGRNRRPPVPMAQTHTRALAALPDHATFLQAMTSDRRPVTPRHHL